MAIYVDELINYNQAPKGGARYFGNGKPSCHMTTDGDVEELHRFAESIGLRRSWFQARSSTPHYDLTPSKRALAVQKGAVEETVQEGVLRRIAARKEPASLGTCSRCGAPLNNVSPGFSATPSGLVCALCLGSGEEIARARSL
jgi:hypothetical protein